MSMPADIRNFMDHNRAAAKSVFTKDIGPLPAPTATGKKGDGGAGAGAGATPTGTGVGGPGATPASATVKAGKQNEADSLRVAAAAGCALLGALGVAVMML